MPVTLYRVDRDVWDADEQVRIDLTRIYADAPEDRIQLPPGTYVTGQLERGFFWTARFNDRLLGPWPSAKAMTAGICVTCVCARRRVGVAWARDCWL